MIPLRIGISIGEPSGVGLEVAIKALAAQEQQANDVAHIIFGPTSLISKNLDTLSAVNLDYKTIYRLEEAESGSLSLFELGHDFIDFSFGRPIPETGRLAFESLESATQALVGEDIDALVTAPIDKANIQHDGFRFPGHTEYLQAKASSESVLMFLVSESLRVGVCTGHIPLQRVSLNITETAILEKLRLMDHSLKTDFGIRQPRIAAFGLNPHAGDEGLIGSEELDTIIPALVKARSEGINVAGPLPADGFFGSSKQTDFDAILAMYHDQGLVPFKALTFGAGVNFTAGLPFIRTSPDHGTAYGIAGKDKADSRSFQKALHLAREIAGNRSTC